MAKIVTRQNRIGYAKVQILLETQKIIETERYNMNNVLYIYGDDEYDDILTNVNEILIQYGFKFDDTTKPETDCMEFQLVELNKD